MTTTLRPTGPETRSAEGGRARSFDIRVNSRRVGSLRLTTDPVCGPSVGRIAELCVDRAARRRGRATVAALAAEEVLRGWDCRRVEASVPEGAAGALRLADALGYTEHGRRLVKPLAAGPVLPAGLADHRMDTREFSQWRAAAQARYGDGADQGTVPPEGTAEGLWTAPPPVPLPTGPADPDTVLRTLRHEGTPVGTLWATLRTADPVRPHPQVLWIDVPVTLRGRGHGRAALLVAERECLAAGKRSLAVEVSPRHAAAGGPCVALGYRPTTRHLSKRL